MKAVVVDDLAGFAEMATHTLRTALGWEMFEPIFTYREALERIPREAPDVVVLDHRIDNGRRGTDIFFLLRGQLPATRWLLLSAYLSAPLLNDVQVSGIDGFVSKTLPTSVLVKGAAEVGAGRRFFCEVASAKMRQQAAASALLNPAERKILALISEGLEAKEIAEVMGVAHKTVLNDLVILRRKTGRHAFVKLAIWARENGLSDVV